MDIKKAIKNISRNKLTSNTQRVALKLLSADGKWLSRGDIAGKSITSVAARIRDLRKKQFGNFRVDCRSAGQLGKRATKKGSFYYRIPPRTVTTKQVSKVFRLS
jgi:hypothetical protein